MRARWKTLLGRSGFRPPEAWDVRTRTEDLVGFQVISNSFDEIYKDWQLTGHILELLKFLEGQAPEAYRYRHL